MASRSATAMCRTTNCGATDPSIAPRSATSRGLFVGERPAPGASRAASVVKAPPVDLAEVRRVRERLAIASEWDLAATRH